MYKNTVTCTKGPAIKNVGKASGNAAKGSKNANIADVQCTYM
jgi:hypothetical protein